MPLSMAHCWTSQQCHPRRSSTMTFPVVSSCRCGFFQFTTTTPRHDVSPSTFYFLPSTRSSAPSSSSVANPCSFFVATPSGHKLLWKSHPAPGILHPAASGWGGVVAKAICGLSSGRRGFVLGPRSPALKSNDPGRLCRGTNSSGCLYGTRVECPRLAPERPAARHDSGWEVAQNTG